MDKIMHNEMGSVVMISLDFYAYPTRPCMCQPPSSSASAVHLEV